MKENHEFKVYLGKTKGKYSERIYLTGFKWECDWYWGGGYIKSNNMHTHFDSCFLGCVDVRGHSLGNFVSPWYKGSFPKDAVEIRNGCSIWENLDFFLDDAQYTPKEWWRIKELYKKFYTIREAAETFYRGVYVDGSMGEINKEMAEKLNKHIETVIIPAIKKALIPTVNERNAIKSLESASL